MTWQLTFLDQPTTQHQSVSRLEQKTPVEKADYVLLYSSSPGGIFETKSGATRESYFKNECVAFETRRNTMCKRPGRGFSWIVIPHTKKIFLFYGK